MEDIIGIIFGYTSYHDYKSLFLINKQWNRSLESEALWKYLFCRNFYKTILPKEFKNWKSFYYHVHKQYLNCERKPKYHFINEAQYDNVDEFYCNPEDETLEISKLVNNHEDGDIVVVKCLSGCDESDLKNQKIEDENIGGFFVFNGTMLVELSFDYMEESMCNYGIVKYPLYFWDFFWDMDTYYIDNVEFLNKFDLITNSMTINGESSTWFIHDYVKYQVYVDRVVEDWLDLSDYCMYFESCKESDYPDGYRTIYLKQEESYDGWSDENDEELHNNCNSSDEDI